MLLEGALILPGDRRSVAESAKSVAKRFQRRLRETCHYRCPYCGDGASSGPAVTHLLESCISEPINRENGVLEECEMSYCSAHPPPYLGSYRCAHVWFYARWLTWCWCCRWERRLQSVNRMSGRRYSASVGTAWRSCDSCIAAVRTRLPSPLGNCVVGDLFLDGEFFFVDSGVN